MRRDPRDAAAALVVELAADADPSTFRNAVEDAGGEVVEELAFDCWLVRLPEAAVDELCGRSGVVRIETAATLERGVDESVIEGEPPEPADDEAGGSGDG